MDKYRNAAIQILKKAKKPLYAKEILCYPKDISFEWLKGGLHSWKMNPRKIFRSNPISVISS